LLNDVRKLVCNKRVARERSGPVFTGAERHVLTNG